MSLCCDGRACLPDRALMPMPLPAVIEEELGRPIEEMYATFSDKPVAAASLGQVRPCVWGAFDSCWPTTQRSAGLMQASGPAGTGYCAGAAASCTHRVCAAVRAAAGKLSLLPPPTLHPSWRPAVHADHVAPMAWPPLPSKALAPAQPCTRPGANRRHEQLHCHDAHPSRGVRVGTRKFPCIARCTAPLCAPRARRWRSRCSGRALGSPSRSTCCC